MGMGGGVGVWRMVGRGRKEKDLMVGQISFYVFCCCVVRMDGFVQNRINEFVQRQFGVVVQSHPSDFAHGRPPIFCRTGKLPRAPKKLGRLRVVVGLVSASGLAFA